MIKKFEGNYEKYIFIIFQVISVLTVLVCIIKNDVQEKSFLAFLPLGFFTCSLIFYKNYFYIMENIPLLFIQGLYFVRLTILPLLYSFNTDMQLFEGSVSITNSFNHACLLMLYEFFAVQFVIYLYMHVVRHRKNRITSWYVPINITACIIIILALIILCITFVFPQYAINFKTIFKLSDAGFTLADESVGYTTGTIGRVIKTLYSMGFQILRVLFPAYIIHKLYKRNPENKWITFFLIVFCILQFMFLTSTFAEAIISCLAIILYYIVLYPKKKKNAFIFLCISTIGMVFLYFVVRYFVNTTTGLYHKDSGPIIYAAQIINAYFTGIDNVAATFNILDGNQGEAFSSDVIGAIPFNSTLFGGHGNKLQYFFNKSNHSYGQIPPTIGAGYYYFGTVLSPIISMLFVYMSLRYYEKSLKCDTSLKYIALIFSSMIFALGTVMYSPAITLSWYLGWGIPLIIITTFIYKQNYS